MPVSKRLMDLVLGAVGLLLLSPVMLLAAILIKLSSPGPVFYMATRAGLHGKPFRLLKFRTMHCGADRLGAITATNDSRVFAAGRLLRNLKIDELPQLINVLKGEMSIVGPRPEDWRIVLEHYTPEQRQVLDAAPGLTGVPQVRFFPEFRGFDQGEMDSQEYYCKVILPMRLKLDVDYIRNRSFWIDLCLIATTGYLILFKAFRLNSR